MGLNYRILWVDDEIGDLIDGGLKTNFETYLHDFGFLPQIDCFEDTKSAKGQLSKQRYDLILSDYNIDGSGNGDALIREIRSGNIFTEVLFYSAHRDFEKVAKALYQDRVSFVSISGQGGIDRLEERTKRLIEQTLTKLQEIENLRGLVMAETSQNDALMKEILSKYFESQSSNTDNRHKKILDSIMGSIKGNLRIDEEFRKLFKDHVRLKLESAPIQQIIGSRAFDASKKARAIAGVISDEKIIIEGHEKINFNKDYGSHVLDDRNNLAHAKSAIDKDGEEYLIIDRKDEEGKTIEENVRFDRKKAIALRTKLRQYHDFLTKLHAKIQAL